MPSTKRSASAAIRHRSSVSTSRTAQRRHKRTASAPGHSSANFVSRSRFTKRPVTPPVSSASTGLPSRVSRGQYRNRRQFRGPPRTEEEGEECQEQGGQAHQHPGHGKDRARLDRIAAEEPPVGNMLRHRHAGVNGKRCGPRRWTSPAVGAERLGLVSPAADAIGRRRLASRRCQSLTSRDFLHARLGAGEFRASSLSNRAPPLC
jgi:hypothetical protein